MSSATRNPYYQLPGGADLPGDVRVSDTPDASKTAAGGWAASPAAVASIENLTHVIAPNFGTDGNSVTFYVKFSASARHYLICFSESQGSGLSAVSIVINSSSGNTVFTEFVSSGLKTTAVTVETYNGYYKIILTYNSNYVYGRVTILPSANVLEIKRSL